MQKKPSLTFPKRFLWGAATSAHQIEGGNHNDWTVWELENAKAKAAQGEYRYHDLEVYEKEKVREEIKSPDNYISGKLADHYNKYEEDFDLIKELNLNAFRFSVEWSRIEPKEGQWDAEAIEHYREYIASLKKRGIEPMMTLIHFTVPEWFREKGAFEKRSNIKYFVRYAEKVINELGKDIRYVITINEPDTVIYMGYLRGEWPPMKQSKWLAWRVANNQIRAHNLAARMIHKTNRRFKVSIAKNSFYFFPGDDAWLSGLSARFFQYVQDDYILKRVRKTCDFIGVNYYFSSRVYGYRIHNEDERLSDLGWDMHPDHLQHVLERLHEKYKLPLIVTENGLADHSDTYRKWWLMKTMMALSEALKEGVDLRGYFHWSLLDNFEWAHGKWPDFGLVEVEYDTMKRTIRPSALWWRKVLGKIQKEAR
ncbi:MAG TPA: glycoside hydrolase family 1 protein [Candidatus Saccharimonadales bacterium]